MKRDADTLLEIIMDLWDKEDTSTLATVVDVLAWERKHPGQGFKQGKPHPERKIVDDLLAAHFTDSLPDNPVLLAKMFEDAKIVGEVKPAEGPKMTASQEKAWAKILAWLATDDPFFTLRGYAGTGKSFIMQHLAKLPHNFYFSAPTNKATKVLSDFIGTSCKTTYSLLGIRMVNNEDKKELGAMGRIPDLGSNPILVIDEASMIPKFMADIIKNICEEFGWRCIFVGDPAQLNPVKEPRSIVWSFPEREWRALLNEVMRFDNEILALSVKLRTCLETKEYLRAPIKNDNSNGEGVFVVPRNKFEKMLASHTVDEWKTRKVACWRNKTVDAYTKMIRMSLGFTNEFDVNDLIMMASPVMGEQGQILAYVDEEFQIKSITTRRFEFDEGAVDALAMTLVDSQLTLYVPEDPSTLEDMLSRRASKASKATGHSRKMLWDQFWKLKEQFHHIRYGYAMTTYRLQGTTLDKIYVDQSDILANPNEREAYRHLYVAATRAKFKLITF